MDSAANTFSTIRIPEKWLPEGVSYGLAPMEGVTDFAVRLWFTLTSPPSFAWTPFLRITDTFPTRISEFFVPEAKFLHGEVPYKVIPQLMGPSVDDFVRTASLLLNEAPFVDLNCGCPSPTVVGNGSGSSLLKSVDEFYDFVESAVNRVGTGKVSVKMRTGYENSSEFLPLVRAIRGLPLAQLAVHGRTRPDRYRGKSKWDLVSQGSTLVNYPVVLSGDVVDFTSAASVIEQAPKIKKIIIGRGALRNPWIFGEKVPVPLLEPLLAFALMQELGILEPHKLLIWAKEGHAAMTAGNNLESWRSVVQSLEFTRSGQSPGDFKNIDVSPRSFARVKMIWSYLRSSLPDVFREPTLMRARSLADFLQQITAIAKSSSIDVNSVSLTYNPELDWMYAGEGRGVSPKP